MDNEKNEIDLFFIGKLRMHPLVGLEPTISPSIPLLPESEEPVEL